jgi:hypothetical protein
MFVAPLLSAMCVSPAAAQNYNLDARVVGMGAVGSTRNIAAEFFEERRPYGRIGLPFGSLEVLANKDVFFYDQDKDTFDVFRSMEYARNPFHYTFNRNASNTGKTLVDDILDGNLNRDLNVYRVFRPARQYVAEGVGFPNWGVTFKFGRSEEARTAEDKRKRDDDGYHGIYIGAGPYLTTTTDTRVDQALIDVLGSADPIARPDATMAITHATTGQAAAAIIGGYRVYLPHRSQGPRREGLYLSANVAYLIGVRLGDLGTTIRFDTDAAGLLIPTPSTVPIEVNWLESSQGRGHVVDLGLAVTLGQWDFGLGVNGIGNRITWQDVERKRFQLQSFFDDSEIEEVDAPPVTEPLRVEVPLNTSTNVAYTTTDGKWSVAAEYSRRFDGNNIQAGAEYRARALEFRGGLRYARDRWHPAGGIGINLGRSVALDAAVFSTSTNVERRRTAALAFSIRIESKPKDGEPAVPLTRPSSRP